MEIKKYFIVRRYIRCIFVINSKIPIDITIFLSYNVRRMRRKFGCI